MNNDSFAGSAYGPLAAVYDRLLWDIDYRVWADFFEECFKRFSSARPFVILDLGCGTGKMTYELMSRGYDMIGLDGSVDMLSEASMHKDDPDNPLFTLQDMRSFELYSSVDAVVSTLDCVNYLTGDGDLLACFKCVRDALVPGGVFLFDANTPYKFENIYADNTYILEDGGDGSPRIFCAWQNSYDKDSRLCEFFLTIFTEQSDGNYIRSEEVQTERCFTIDEIKSALDASGLEFCGVFGGFDFSAPSDKCERWLIAARRPQ